MSKTVAELKAENRDLKERLARAEKIIDRLLAEPSRAREVQKEFVPMPYPVPAPTPPPIWPPAPLPIYPYPFPPIQFPDGIWCATN